VLYKPRLPLALDYFGLGSSAGGVVQYELHSIACGYVVASVWLESELEGERPLDLGPLGCCSASSKQVSVYASLLLLRTVCFFC
jgi:hypothetical protein